MGPHVGIVFWILAFTTVVSAMLVVSLKNIFHCALFLILCLFSVAGIYVLLDADFLAAAQVLIYVGAVSILMIFAIMLTSNLASAKIRQSNESVLVAAFVSIVFALAMFIMLGGTRTIWRDIKPTSPTDLAVHNVLNLGKLLMTKYVLPFEVVSVLLLAAMIGAIVLARKERS